eukprot:Tamp_09803.p1 GENE.Tamp_09803~~Tamp_09803.p1  ORF type:complete len:611 (-),score=99.95 Tamp_09803:293-2053(-)
MATFERRPSLTSYDIEKAVAAERDNKFGRGKARPKESSISTDDGVLRISTADVTSASNSRPSTTVDQPSGDPTPLERPYAGIRDMGKVRSGVDKLLPTQKAGRPGKLTRRVSMAENIQQLGQSVSSPYSPASPASPSTIRSPLRFFRKREDVRDSIIAQTKTAREQKPPQVLRERVKEVGMARMDQDWERVQRPSLLLRISSSLSAISAFVLRMLLFGWGPWFRKTFVVGDEEMESYMAAVRALPLHSLPRLRALEAILNLSYSPGNQLAMVQNDLLPMLILEIRQAHDGSPQQAVALAIVRNLCALSGFRQNAVNEVGDILIAVCWAVEDDVCKQHALGALANLTANARPSELLVNLEVIEPLLYLSTYGSNFSKLLTTPQIQVRALALMALHNLAVVQTNRHRLLKHKALEKLKMLFLEPALCGLLATLTSMQLITHKGHPMLIFSEKMRNIPEVVLCLKHALEGKALYGLVWNPRHVLKAINTLMLFEPNHRLLVKAGVDDLLVRVVFGQCEAIRDRWFMDMARSMRTTLAPLVLKFGSSRRGEMTEADADAEQIRRHALIGLEYFPPIRPRSISDSAALARA